MLIRYNSEYRSPRILNYLNSDRIAPLPVFFLKGKIGVVVLGERGSEDLGGEEEGEIAVWMYCMRK